MTGFQEEQGNLIQKLGVLQGTEEFKKGDKDALEAAAVNKRRQITVAQRLSEINDKLALGAENQTPREFYRFPDGISLPPNDPLYKKYIKGQDDWLLQQEAFNRMSDAAKSMGSPILKPNTPLQQAEAFKKSLNPDELRRLNQYSNPFGNR